MNSDGAYTEYTYVIRFRVYSDTIFYKPSTPLAFVFRFDGRSEYYEQFSSLQYRLVPISSCDIT